MILIPLISAAGCTGKSPVPSGFLLTRTGWALKDYVSGGASLQPLNGSTVTLNFDKEGQITGSAGCNHYFVRYEMNGTAITIGQAGSTEMYCTAPGLMEQESTYLVLLGKVASGTAGNTSLTFADAKGSTILSFARIIPPEPAPFVGTNWTLDSFYKADAVSSVIAGTTITAVFDKDGNVAGSAGRNHYFASYSVTETSISIGSAGSTKMFCTGPDIGQNPNCGFTVPTIAGPVRAFREMSGIIPRTAHPGVPLTKPMAGTIGSG